MKNKITYEELHKLFYYDPSTGLLVRKITTGRRGKAGTVVGTLNNGGYLKVKINSKQYLIHRIVYCMHHGYWPEKGIDHINRIKTDNRIENLREAGQVCNRRNSKLDSNNTSGIRGISWDNKSEKWRAYIKINNKQLHLGLFKDLNSAVIVRYMAELDHSWNKCDTESSAQQYLIEHGLID